MDEWEHWRRLQRPGYQPKAVVIYYVAESRKEENMSAEEITKILVAIGKLEEKVDNLVREFAASSHRQEMIEEKHEYRASDNRDHIDKLERYRDETVSERRILYALVGGAWALVLIVAGTLLRMNLHI